ncbi:uncharacterized protein LY89DRAFT_50492 [Mollisia scopiformis]|uniref:Fatty acid hydroxylase domain-containing protein n=1 Tax=Mollisia scopiformis TaxID=149040 RepID=A0A194XAY6_MOLSC|nr:uncharacterized protein LY89DRAFT_50492 [Mollisia scopiformis]KUJ17309.1 hypothetical protein LY89DRAFT_50492 [Mollisia scopiformis]
MMELRLLLSLHVLLAVTLLAVSLKGVGAVDASEDCLGNASPGMSIEDNIVDIHIEHQEPLERYGSKYQSKTTLGRNTPFQHSIVACSSLSVFPISITSNEVSLNYPSAAANASNNSQLTTTSTRPVTSNTSRGHDSRYWFSSIEHVLDFALQALTASSPPVLFLSILWLYFSGSFFFDVGHWTMHKCSKSRSRILRSIGYLHEVHHLYFNRRLKFNDRYQWQNMCYELPLELSCQLFGTWLGYLLANSVGLTGPGLISKEILTLVLAFETVRSFVVACMEGRDSNHKSYSPVVPKDPHPFLVGPEYHALHHVDPSSYIGSTFKVFDWFLGTSCSLQSRRVTVAGDLGAYGPALKQELLSESVSCIEDLNILSTDSKESNGRIEVLARTDILIIGSEPGSDELIDLFKKYHKAKASQSLLLPEVWCFDTRKASLQQVKERHNDEDILYRHIVCHSERQWLGLRPEWAASMAIWWIRRGMRTVPASCDVLALFR